MCNRTTILYTTQPYSTSTVVNRGTKVIRQVAGRGTNFLEKAERFFFIGGTKKSAEGKHKGSRA